jgi:ankyrin repeat protein
MPYDGKFHQAAGEGHKEIVEQLIDKGAVVGSLLWGWLGYMVCRNKNAAPNRVIPDDSTT